MDTSGNKMEIRKFESFYKEIRAYFTACVIEFETFKGCPSLEAKIKYLLDNAPARTVMMSLHSPHVARVRRPAEAMALEGVVPVPPINPKSKRHPQLTSKAKVAESKAKGRQLVAAQKISPGEVIVHEAPYVTVLYGKFISTNCSNCFKKLSSAVKQECSRCKQANYCSAVCQETHEALTHWSECQKIHLFTEDAEIGVMSMMVYRTMIRAGFPRVKEAVENRSRFPPSAHKPVYDSVDYAAVAAQCTREDARDAGEIFRRILTAVYVAFLLSLTDFFPDKEEEEEGEEGAPDDLFSSDNADFTLVVGAIARHLMSCSCNAYEISEMIGVSVSNELGGAVYPTVSLSNHACSPNTIRYNDGTRVYLRAARTIFPGEEIYDNYGHFFQIAPAGERQAALRRQYFFDCACKACRDDWPQLGELRQEATVFLCKFCKRGPLKEAAKKKCPSCKKDIKALDKVRKSLRDLEADMKRVVTALNRENGLDTREYLKALLVEAEAWVHSPAWQLLIVQQIIAQSYSIEGNHYPSEEAVVP